ncbi:hypothetical protein B0H14DRAFT_3464162 [Mycena olivaceomarginata]|nr:hypothetical protein B0H14DRAFT_3464162 [Mycena olivaceomarginata]
MNSIALNIQLNSLGEFINTQNNNCTTHHNDGYTTDLVLAITCITQMEACINSLATTTQNILACVSALSSSSLPAAPPAEVDLSDLDPATLKELLYQVLNGNGKRVHNNA